MYLDFLNKNMYRSYPLKAGSSGISIYGETLPDSLLTSLSLSVPNDYGYRGLYISKVVVKGQFISVVFNDYDTGFALGSFSKLVTKDYESINLTPYIPTASGVLTVGRKEGLLEFQGVYHFERENTEIEESVLFIYPPPGVINLVNNAIASTGHITLIGKNIEVSTGDSEILLDVIDTNRVRAHNTLAGQYNNCNNPIIEKLNTVTPDEDGNIDIYTILPMTIEVSGDNLTLIPNLTLEQVCPDLNKIYPPDNASEEYYSDINTEKVPEWKTWPYFN